MTQYKSIQGSMPIVQPLEINVDTVYIRSNIKDIHDEDHPVLWRYDEIQMPVVEYLKQIVPQNQEISDSTTAELSIIIAEYQKQTDEAIAELSVLIGGANNV